jgi:drug/metabolite transporter (DMT)-like permease
VRGMSGLVLFVWIVTCAIWSTVWLFIKIGVRDVPPVTFAVFRLGAAFAVLAPITLLRKTPLPRAGREWGLIAATGVVLLGVNYALLNWGIQFISSGLTAVLQALTPAFGFVFAHSLLHDEKMTPLKGAALLLGIAGVGAIFFHQLELSGSRALWGGVAVVAGSACVALVYVVMRRHGRHLHPSVVTSGQMLAAIGPLSMYALAVEGNPLRVRWTAAAVVSVLYLALLGSIAGAWLNYWLLARIGATRLLVMGLIEPLIAVLLGALLLGETMTGWTLAGGICIIVSVALVLDLFERTPAGRAQL